MMRVLLFCDEHYHPGKVAIEGVAPLKEKGYEFDIIKNGKDFKPEILANYSVVLMGKCDDSTPEDQSSWKTPEIQQAFIDFVEKGGGMMVVHNGTVAGENTGAMDKLVGSKFKWHPQDSMVTVEPIKPHPVTEGVGIFCEEDEHYHLEILADDVDIVMASFSPAQGTPEKYEEEPYTNTPAKISPNAYVRTQGKGRVCVFASGHTLPVWLNPQFQRFLDNGLRWCAGEI
jgi:type 1 glutamine amidotransferase